MSQTPGYENELAVALEAVRLAAKLCQSVRKEITPGTLSKADLSPVTVADFGSQALIARALATALPDDLLVAEEDAADLRKPENSAALTSVSQHVAKLVPGADAETVLAWIDRGASNADPRRFWTLDPIDGTKGFLRGDQYAIALALIVDGRVEVAALACPALPQGLNPGAPEGVVFAAIRGQGAKDQPLDQPGDAGASISVASDADPSAVRFCESQESGHSSHSHAADVAKILGITASPIRMDSQAKYGVVARGQAHLYLRLPTRADYREKIWDHAAGSLIITEAGGLVTDVDGRPLDFSLGRELLSNRGVAASASAQLHDRVLHALRQVGV